MQPQQPTQNLKMMRVEPHEKDPNVNIALRSGVMTGKDKGKQPEESEWVCKELEKEDGFDLECVKETFMEAKKTFAKASTSGSQDKQFEEMDPSMLTTFSKTCMKLLHNRKAIKGLQELINKCVGNTPKGPHVFKKIGKLKERIGHEMRLTAQIGEYEMDQVILDLGSDANVFPKNTWERMGRPMVQCSPIQLRRANHQNIILMRRLQGVTVDIECTSALANFKVIDITDDNIPYPVLLGINQVIDMNM